MRQTTGGHGRVGTRSYSGTGRYRLNGIGTEQYLLVCAGLTADRKVRMTHSPTEIRIIPFRSEYYQLPHQPNHIVKHLIYSIPDPELPFLGIHLTRMIDGSITVCPNAVLG